jgi:GT2 family glycosyltransferase
MIVIVTPVHNRWELTKKFLLSLRRQTCQDFSVVIVNDCSDDETLENLATEFSEVEVVNTTREMWWTGGIQNGCEHVITNYKDMEYIIIANNDLIVAENTVENLYTCAKQNHDTIIGSVVKDMKKKDLIYDGACQINWRRFNCQQIPVNETGLIFDNVDVLSGRFTIIPRQAVKSIGFDVSTFPHYLGDLDFFIRAKRAGYKLALCCDAVCFDTGGASGFHALKKDYGLVRFVQSQFSISSHENFFIFLNFFMRNAPTNGLKIYNVFRRFGIFLLRMLLAMVYTIFYPIVYMSYFFRKNKPSGSID